MIIFLGSTSLHLDSVPSIHIHRIVRMEAVRAGKVGDTIVTFFPTPAHMARPSYLEINMTETLLTSFREASAFAINQMEHANKRRIAKRFVDVLLTSIEVHAAFTKNATAAEAYFGLHRVRRDGTSPIASIHRMVTVIESVVLPHLLAKTRDGDRLVGGYRAAQSLFAMLYIANLSPYSNPVHFLCGIRLARKRTPPTANTSLLSKSASWLVWALIYTIQLAQWYFAHEHLLRPRRPQSQSVPPPQLSANGLPSDPRLCPLCLKLRRNPTALLATGHVFCYSCIVAKLKASGADKVSKFIRRIVDA